MHLCDIGLWDDYCCDMTSSRADRGEVERIGVLVLSSCDFELCVCGGVAQPAAAPSPGSISNFLNIIDLGENGGKSLGTQILFDSGSISNMMDMLLTFFKLISIDQIYQKTVHTIMLDNFMGGNKDCEINLDYFIVERCIGFEILSFWSSSVK